MIKIVNEMSPVRKLGITVSYSQDIGNQAVSHENIVTFVRRLHLCTVVIITLKVTYLYIFASPKLPLMLNMHKVMYKCLKMKCYYTELFGVSWSIWSSVGNRQYTGSVFYLCPRTCSLQWCHNESHGISNHLRLYCLFNGLFSRRSKKNQNSGVTGLCERNSPVTGELPAQRASNTENVSIWWCHHAQ